MRNNADQTQDREIYRIIGEMKRELVALKDVQPPTISLTSSFAGTVTLTGGAWVQLVANLNPANDERLLALAEVSWFRDADIDAASMYPSGSDWSGAPTTQQIIREDWYDWGESNGKKLVYKSLLKNTSGTTINPYVRGQWRFLHTGAS